MVENVIQINSGIMTIVDVSLKNIINVKKNIFGVILNFVAKIVNI